MNMDKFVKRWCRALSVLQKGDAAVSPLPPAPAADDIFYLKIKIAVANGLGDRRWHQMGDGQARFHPRADL